MGNLIIKDNRMLYVYPSLAVNIGFNEAMVAHRLYKLIHESDKVIGHWIMMSSEQWNEEFPFWSRSTVQRTFTSLEDQGIVLSRKLIRQEIASMLQRKQPQRLNTEFRPFYYCEWCDGETFILNEHHYPIPKENDGDRTVKICPNCHYEFHSLETTTLYSLSQKLINEFDEVEMSNELG